MHSLMPLYIRALRKLLFQVGGGGVEGVMPISAPGFLRFPSKLSMGQSAPDHLFALCYRYLTRVGRYFDIFIYRNIFNRNYRIEGRNLREIISVAFIAILSNIVIISLTIIVK
jgi:hypothetical protein